MKGNTRSRRKELALAVSAALALAASVPAGPAGESAPAGFPALLQLSDLDGTNGFKLDGYFSEFVDDVSGDTHYSGDGTGWSVSAAGDVNGDGVDDLIVGARGAWPNGPQTGRSYVVFGNPAPPAMPAAPSGRFFNPLPETGAWFANDDSKTGFYFEIQNGILAGAYFGFDNGGDNVWLIFSGALQPRTLPGEEFQDGWRIEAPLLRFADGRCILNCAPGNPPVFPTNEIAGEIAIEFSGRNEAAFQVDGAEPVPIVPLYFGTAGFAFDPGQPLRFLPDLAGRWVAAQTNAPDLVAFTRAGIVEIGAMQVSEPPDAMPEPGEPFLEVRFPIFDSGDFSFVYGEIVCRYLSGDTDNPHCTIPQITSGFEDSILAGKQITDSRFTPFLPTEVAGLAHRFDFFRLNHD